MTEKRKCSFEECSIEYIPTAHNKIYCSAECCRKATNKKVRDKYRAKVDRRSKDFYCKKCGGKLSRYTEHDVCFYCKKESDKESLKAIISSMKNVKWD